MDDGEVIAASMADGQAFGAIFERHHEAIARYARQRVGDAPGEDIAARVFVIAFSRRDRFDTTVASARPWLYGIATNLIRHHLRDERTHLLARGRIPVQLVEPDPNEDVTRLDAHRLSGTIRDALQALSDGDRDVLLLHVLGELSYEEVALALGIPSGTVKSRANRARRLVRERIGADAGIRSWMSDADRDETGDG